MKGSLATLCSGFVIMVCSIVLAENVDELNKMGVYETYLEFGADYYIPQSKNHEKIPVVFLAHNGGSNKDGWGDFPQALMKEGFMVVNFNWNSAMLRTNLEVESVIQHTFKKHGDRADSTRVAFIGGCRGGANMIAQLSRLKKIPCNVKTVVALSISEDTTYVDMMKGIRTGHAPILSYYCTKDRLGPKYQELTSNFAEQILTEPKTVIKLDATPHGHELVTDQVTKELVRKEIVDWLKRDLVQ